VAFYVPLGPRGLIFRLGTFVIGIWGGLVYRLAYHRRVVIVGNPGPILARCYGIHAYTSLEDAPMVSSMLTPGSRATEIEAAAMA
jgi:hypothetical protein